MVWGCLRNSDPGLKPPTCRWLISYPIEKSQGIQAPETSNVLFSPWNCMWPQQDHFGCVICLCRHHDRTEGEGNFGSIWFKLIKTADVLYATDHCGSISHMDTKITKVIFSDLINQESGRPPIIRNTLLPPCYHQASPGEMLVECLGSEALPWRISWIRPLDWAQKLLETAWRFAWKARCEPYKLGPRW